MKKTVGVLAIASVFSAGIYFYFTNSQTQTKESSPATATASDALKAQPEAKAEDKKAPADTKPAPDLKSFEGLDEESNNIFNGDGGTQSPNEDPLKAATQ